MRADSQNLLGIAMMEHQLYLMRIKILSKYWTIRWVPFLGQNLGTCDRPFIKNKAIVIQQGLSEQEEAIVIAHEITHAAFDFLDEEVVDEFSQDLINVLYKLGWRKTKL